MIKAELWKVDRGGWKCSNFNCPHSLQYHDKLLTTFHLKIGITCLVLKIYLDRYESYENLYCQDCVKELYKHLKPLLNTDLWVFND